MLLRSSSTPVLGSLLSSFSETPNNNYSNSDVPNTNLHNYGKIFHNKHNHAAAGPQNLTRSLYNSSPISPSISELSGNNYTRGFRRAQSEGNLEGLVSASANLDDEFSFSIPTKKFSRRPPHCSTLEAIPSFSYHNSRNRNEDEDSEEEEEDEKEEERLAKENGSVYDSVGKENFYYLKGDRKYARGYENNVGVEKEMYLARGLGIADLNFADIGGHITGGSRGGGGGGGQDYIPVALGGDGGDNNGLIMEDHYKRMLEEDPSNPLWLRNYAHFLHQVRIFSYCLISFLDLLLSFTSCSMDKICIAEQETSSLFYHIHQDNQTTLNKFLLLPDKERPSKCRGVLQPSYFSRSTRRRSFVTIC